MTLWCFYAIIQAWFIMSCAFVLVLFHSCDRPCRILLEHPRCFSSTSAIAVLPVRSTFSTTFGDPSFGRRKGMSTAISMQYTTWQGTSVSQTASCSHENRKTRESLARGQAHFQIMHDTKRRNKHEMMCITNYDATTRER